eukprot:TRINITY_DN92398_c0_g1_i1.p1 TRINITY_DN92398_c0_g1~~TRINITY_DN92398_c0_g1_i1.p1  ORF type:complete len:221 (-),score=54.13 TRINITY_DN92398_c0_g1_i1:155-817(-)
MAFAGSIQSRTARDYAGACKHLPELKEKARRIAFLEEKVREAEEKQRQAETEAELLRIQLQRAEVVRHRNEAVLESQRKAIQQLNLALDAQQKTVDRILGDGNDFDEVTAEVQRLNQTAKQVTTPKATAPARLAAQPQATRFGFGGAADATRQDAADLDQSEDESESDSEQSEPYRTLVPAPPKVTGPTARLYVADSPRQDDSRTRTPSPVPGGTGVRFL